MSKEQKPSPNQKPNRGPLTEERGLQPTKNPPPMPQVKPPRQEKGS